MPIEPIALMLVVPGLLDHDRALLMSLLASTAADAPTGDAPDRNAAQLAFAAQLAPGSLAL